MSSISKVLEVPDWLKINVLKSYNKTEEDIQNDLEILYIWWAKQPHLPKLKDDEYLMRLLINNKFRIEQTKDKIDALFTAKQKYPEYFKPDLINPKNEMYKKFQKSCYYFLLRKPLPTGERILYYSIKDTNPDLYDVENFITHGYIYLELFNKYDFCSSVCVIADLQNLTMTIVKKWDLIFIEKVFKFLKVLSCRVAGLHIINGPHFMDLVNTLVLYVLKKHKIHYHKSLEDLYKVIPKEYLPKDIGGTLNSLQEIQDNWIEEIGNQQDFLQERIVLVSDESLRLEKLEKSEAFGMEGTFKKINID